MPNPTRRRFLHEYGSLVLILAVVLLLGIACHYAAQSSERRIQKIELEFAAHLLDSKERPERIATELAGEVQRLHEDQFWVGVLRHISIAFFISFIIILAVELHTRRLTRRDFDTHLEVTGRNFRTHLEAVKRNVWAAIGKRLLGEHIATELEAIMKETAAKVGCTYLITFKQPENEFAHDRDHVVVEIVNTFQLRSLSDEKEGDRTFHFRSSVSGYEELGNLPRYTLFKKGETEEKNPNTDKENKTLLARDIELPETPEGRVEVAVGMEIPYKLRDSEAFITEVPIEGLDVWVNNLIPGLVGDIRVVMIHRCEQMKKPIPGVHWTFSKAILPGQGFHISWKEAAKQLPAHTHAGSTTLVARPN